MSATQWAEFAGLGFALAVLAWVIYRLTGTLRDLVLRRIGMGGPVMFRQGRHVR